MWNCSRNFPRELDKPLQLTRLGSIPCAQFDIGNNQSLIRKQVLNCLYFCFVLLFGETEENKTIFFSKPRELRSLDLQSTLP